MTNNITVKEMCILIRGGIEIWLPEEKAIRFQKDLESEGTGKFVKIEGRTVNIVEIIGIFSPTDLEDVKRRQRGDYKCKFNNWHEKGEICNCYYQTDEYKESQKLPQVRELTPEQIQKGREVMKSLINKNKKI